MQQADITAITRDLAGLVAERYVFPGLGADLSQLLEGGLADGRYTLAADEEALATTLTEDLQSLNGDKHLRLLHSAAEVPERGDEAAELAAMAGWAERTAGGIARAERLDGNVGYLDLQPLLFPPSVAGEAVAAAMTLIAPADALLIDLRQCLGGDPDMVAMLCTYLFGPDRVHLIDVIGQAEDGTAEVRQSWTMPFAPGRRFGPDKPVFVLTSGTTFPAARNWPTTSSNWAGLPWSASVPGAAPTRWRGSGSGRTCRRPSPSPAPSAPSPAATGKVPASFPMSPWRPPRRWTPPASGPGRASSAVSGRLRRSQPSAPAPAPSAVSGRLQRPSGSGPALA